MTISINTLQKSALELQSLLQNRQLSARELVRSILDRIEENKRINAVCTVNPEALDRAEELDQLGPGHPKSGPLHGLPVGIKDVTPTAGLRTTFGSRPYEDHVPEEDALVVRRFKEAGAIIIGKTNTPEFAAGGNTFNEVFGRTRNPWDTSKSAGGSTGGGAAALACGLIAFAEGTDLGGSLRIPASFCGIAGLRPTPGLVPTVPSKYLWDNMQVSGTMARTPKDIAFSLDNIAGISPECPVGVRTEDRRFLDEVKSGFNNPITAVYCDDIAGIGIDSNVESICREAADDLKSTEHTLHYKNMDLSEGWEPFLSIRGFWMLAHHHHHLEKIDEFGDNLAGNIQSGLDTSAEDLGIAEQARTRLWNRFYEFFQEYDFLLTPTMAVPPFSADKNYPETIGGNRMETYIDWVAPTFILSLTGLPVASVPVGTTENGLPVGLQIVGPQHGEEQVLTLAQEIQNQQQVGLPQMDQ